jgi:hypothetical protein
MEVWGADKISKDKLFILCVGGIQGVRQFCSICAGVVGFYSNGSLLLRLSCGADVQSLGDCAIHAH